MASDPTNELTQLITNYFTVANRHNRLDPANINPNHVIQLINLGANINAHDPVYLNTILHVFAHSGNVEMIQYLTSKNANIHSRDTIGFTPLHHSTIRGHLDAVKCLVECGSQTSPAIDIDKPDYYGDTALIFSVKQGKLDIFKYLLDHGADPHKPDGYQMTALDFAFDFGYQEMIDYCELPVKGTGQD
jgi:ankyrin repeat protein